MFKQEKGITLVALVVTIVVLLILAGVTISLVIGDNGLITKAQDSQSEQDKAYAKEQVEFALKTVQIEVLSDKLPAGKTANTAYVVETIGKDSFTSTKDNEIIYETESGDTYTVTIELTDYTVTDVK